MKADMQWNPGDLALDQDFYFGTDPNRVRDANSKHVGPAHLWPEYKGNKTESPQVYSGIGTPGVSGMYPRYRYDVGTKEALVMGTTYYWRVDELNSPQSWKGNVWSFTIQTYAVVDRFDEYTASGDIDGPITDLRRTWIDGYVGVGYQTG